MQAIKLTAEIGPDHRLALTLPPEIPQGSVEVIILADAAQKVAPTSSLREFFDEIDRFPGPRRTKEEIDQYLAEERASWE